MNKRGFTLVEFLVALSIFSLFAVMTFQAYRNWQRQVQLINATDNLKSTLLRAQQLAAAAAESEAWGVHLDSQEYVLFKGLAFNQTDPTNKVVALSGVQILNPATSLSDGQGGSSADAIFNEGTGQTVNSGTISLQAVFDAASIKIITIQTTGRVD